LAAIFRRYQDDLFRYCVALLGNSDDAADALQNTMVKVLGALPGERRRLNLKPWLYRIAHNESIELVRKRQDHEPIDPEALTGFEGPEVGAETRERLRQLIVDLHELPERQRGSLVMRELGGLSFEQIGAAFETSAAVARQTVYEARIGLQEMERGRSMECDEVRHKLSDGDRRIFRRRDVRAHLRHCRGCRDFEAAISIRRADLVAISPLPALAAAGVLKAVIGGAAGASAGSAAGAGAAGSAITASVAAKTVATVAVAGAIGVGAAEQAGVVHVFQGGGGEAQKAAPAAPRGDDPGAGGASDTEQPAEAKADEAHVGAASPRPGGPAVEAEAGKQQAPPAAPAGSEGTTVRSSAPTVPAKASGSSSSRASGRGHEKVTGKGAGSANAHGGNPNAHGGNPNAKGGNPAAATNQAQHGVRDGNGKAHGNAKPAGEPGTPRKEAEPGAKSPGGQSKAPPSGVEPGFQPESGSPPAHGKPDG